MASAGFTPTMSAEDTVLWNIERDPTLRSTVTAIALLDRLPDHDRLRQRVELAVQALPRLRQRVVESPLGWRRPRWVDEPLVDLDYHLRFVGAPSGDPSWLLRFAASLAEAGLDRARPLWELVVVGGLAGDGAAIVQKVHHSLTDGVGGMELLLSMLDSTRHPGGPPSLPPVPTTGTGRGLPDPLGWAARSSRSVARQVPALARAAANPPRLATDAWRTGRSVARILAPAGPRRSPLMSGHSTNWVFGIHEEPMAALHRAAAATGATVNDIFVTAVAGGLHRYHVRHGYEVDNLRMTLPISFRRTGDPMGGNRFTPVRFDVPVSEPDVRRRLHQIGALCRQWRHEPALPLTDAIAGVLSRLPPPATIAVMGSMLRGTDFVATNVPGLPVRCFVAGAEVRREHAFAPLSGAAVNVALVSHVATACIGLTMDRVAVADPEELVACVADGFAEILALGAGRHNGSGRTSRASRHHQAGEVRAADTPTADTPTADTPTAEIRPGDGRRRAGPAGDGRTGAVPAGDRRGSHGDH